MKSITTKSTASQIAAYNEANAEAISLGLINPIAQCAEGARLEAKAEAEAVARRKSEAITQQRTDKLASIIARIQASLATAGLPQSKVSVDLNIAHANTGSSWSTGPAVGLSLRYDYRHIATYRFLADTSAINWPKLEAKLTELMTDDAKLIQQGLVANAAKAKGRAAFADLAPAAKAAIHPDIQAKASEKNAENLDLYYVESVHNPYASHAHRYTEYTRVPYANVTIAQVEQIIAAHQAKNLALAAAQAAHKEAVAAILAHSVA